MAYYTRFSFTLKPHLSPPAASSKSRLQSITSPTPHIIPRPAHSLSRANISPNALRVLYRLKQSGYAAYLVGGGVRDLLLGHEPKDFDIATDATPEQVQAVFRNCRLIGRRFRLAHVVFGDEIVEVATFRGGGGQQSLESPRNEAATHGRRIENGMIVRDNIYGSIAEDALRRDFTINAIYYNIDDFSLVDYTDGLRDLNAGYLRLIGDDPSARYREDPVRMLRAVRFICKLGFIFNPACEAPLFQLAPLLRDVSAARLFEEVLKLFHAGYALPAFEKLRHYGLFAELFPATDACLAQEEEGFPITFVNRGLANTDARLQSNKPVAVCFLFALLLWPPVRQRYQRLLTADHAPMDAMAQATADIANQQQQRVAIPRRFGLPMREIWTLQPRFEHQYGKRATLLLGHPRFRAAYDFLLLRAAAGEIEAIAVAEWWTRFYESSQAERAKMMTPRKKPRRRRRSTTEKPIGELDEE
ncbi:polynucleotide adenylyltransferase PcnB [Rhodoferax sp. 4810]|uniref:Poly(A) polymerase I n=1 Tax=Thiospirillum jenense TaxID=1653858 RepID=A0A839HFW5_9GAMM|nr:polynucleotide adenylyltransferase PcnB [Rhodoferax jenense]MBB1125849.1 polynucleotide adenylyltransferase PcnB [Thiospirillum jenense]